MNIASTVDKSGNPSTTRREQTVKKFHDTGARTEKNGKNERSKKVIRGNGNGNKNTPLAAVNACCLEA